MANTSEEPVADGKRFKADSLRITVLAVAACGVYGAGILTVMLAAYFTVKAAHASAPVPVLPWVAAFVLVVSGMLSIIYGFFFRPRELRLSEDQVALVYWDGNGKKMHRNQVETVRAGSARIVLRGGGKTLVVGRIFRDWDRIRAELGAWDRGNRGVKS
jgi:hypothetical protein